MKVFRRTPDAASPESDSGTKYRSIVENAVAGVFQTSPDGRYLTANPALARIYGYPSADALTAELTDIAGQLYVEPNRRAEFQRLLTSQDVVEGFESEIYRRDGSVIWISESARAVRADDGRVVHYEGHVLDVTDRKQAELALAQSREELRNHRDHLEETVAARTADLRTLNEQLRGEVADRERVLGIAPADVEGRPVLDLMHPGDRPKMESYWAHVAHGEGLAPSIQCRGRHVDGAWRRAPGGGARDALGARPRHRHERSSPSSTASTTPRRAGSAAPVSDSRS